MLRRSLLITVVLAGLASGCGGERPTTSADPPDPPDSAFVEALDELPDGRALRRQVLYGDLARLRTTYEGSAELEETLAAVWLPDALAGAADPAWPRQYGFALGDVDRFLAVGFHPRQATALTGRFDPAEVMQKLRELGYRKRGRFLSRAPNAPLDAGSELGRLVLGSLDRVLVTEDSLVAASTTSIARSILESSDAIGTVPDLRAAAGALGEVTSAVVLPTELVRPPVGVPFSTLTTHRPALVAVGLDDRGRESRTVRIALVYAEPPSARDDAVAIRERLAGTLVPSDRTRTFGSLLGELEVEVVGERTVLLSARLPPGAGAGMWRGLLETGDLAVIVSQAG